MRRSGQVNLQDHREEGPEKTGLQHKRGRRRRQDMKQLVMIPMPGSSDDHRRQPTTETDVIDQSIVMDSGTARVSDEGADQGVLRMDQEEGISAEEQARRRLRSKQPARRSLTDDETVSKRLKREATIATITQEISENCCREGPIWNRHTNFTQASEH